jgi:6,7-dimethyl-8-ribityllumazine synthase
MRNVTHLQLDASLLSIGVAISRYHAEITDALLKGAVDAFTRAGGTEDRLHIVEAAGAWELTAICRALAASGTVQSDNGGARDAVVALGCILTGETIHDAYIAQSVTHGLTEITVQTGVPIAFGVLTCQTLDQARARAGLVAGGGNKGVEAMEAAIATAMELHRLADLQRSTR